MFDNFVKLVTHYMDKQYTRAEAIKMAREDLKAMWMEFFIVESMDSYDEEGKEITCSMDDYFPDQLYMYSERKALEERMAKSAEELEAEQKTQAENEGGGNQQQQ